jgi:hypothetical protein
MNSFKRHSDIVQKAASQRRKAVRRKGREIGMLLDFFLGKLAPLNFRPTSFVFSLIANVEKKTQIRTCLPSTACQTTLSRFF